MKHCLVDGAYNIDLSDDQVIALALSGKIRKCDGDHEGQPEEDVVYHLTQGFELDLSRIETLIQEKK